VESANGDIRLILGQLQMVRLRSAALSYEDVKGRLGAAKDADMSPFECARRLLEPGTERLPLYERLDWVFMDMDLVPLLVQVGGQGSGLCMVLLVLLGAVSG
jgi:replication factor C subunit 1